MWARDLYQQGTALIAAGDTAQAKRMAQWLWNDQRITAWTPGDGVTYGPGSFPRYSPVSGVSSATPQQLGCCEQLDQDAYPIILAWQTGLTDAATWNKVKLTADHIVAPRPGQPGRRWEDQAGTSPSTVAAAIAGLVSPATSRATTATPRARRRREHRRLLVEPARRWTFTTSGSSATTPTTSGSSTTANPDDTYARVFDDGTWYEHDIVTAGSSTSYGSASARPATAT